jgi:thiol-disulfide isomerase/thioredoxin
MKKRIIFLLLNLFVYLLIAVVSPEFTIETFDSKKIKSSSLLEKGPIFLDFWGTSCEPCLKALPHISDFVNKYPQINFVGINIDSPRNKDKAQKLIKSKKFKFIAGYDSSNNLRTLFGVNEIPRTIIIDTTGEIIYDGSSFTPGDEAKYEKIIKELLNKE